MADWLSSWLSSSWLPVVLLLGAFGDAFIFSAFFVPGEIFFVAAGYAFAGQWSFHVILWIWLGAVSGDVVSYVLGRYYGMTLLYKWVKKRPKLRLHVKRAKLLMRRKGVMTLVLARIAGPVSKLTPFLAGSLKMPFRPFSAASACGVLLGTAQFILAGWLLGKGVNNTALFSEIWRYFQHRPLLLVLTAGLILLGGGFYIRRKTIGR